jgi:hypothetical protein
LYDGTSVINLSNSFYSERFAQISNSGVVWSSNGEIYLYDWAGVTRITNNGYSDGSPQINNSGQIVWTGDGEIYMYDGSSITNISNNTYLNSFPQVNDNGQVVWMMGEWPDYEIYLYDGTTVNNISNNSYDNYEPKINSNGQAVWMVDEGSDYEIYLYDGASVINISNNPYDDMYPQINDNGYVVWAGFNGSTWDIYLYDGIEVTNISNRAYANGRPPQINNNNYVVWDGDGKIYLAIPSNQAVEVISPNGGELIPSESTYPISWGASFEAVKFKLEYSKNNGISWALIANNITGTSYNWTAPKPIANKTQCLVRITGYDSLAIKVGEDISDNPFTIEVAKLLSPDSGEVLTSGSPYTVTWRTNATKKPVAKTKLKYSCDGGIIWTQIITLTGNPGSYIWNVSPVSTIKTQCKAKVVLKDTAGNTLGSDVSDGFFTIQPAP